MDPCTTQPDATRRLSEYEALVASAPAALDAIPGAVYLCDTTGMLVKYNHEARELWGREPRLRDPSERFCGSFALYHLDGQSLRREDTPMARALVTGEPARNFEVVMERPDGRRFIALVNIRALMDENGKIQGAINCFQDITARKMLEEELRRSKDALAESDRRLRELLEALPAAIYTTAPDGRITFYNRASIELAGRTPELGVSQWCISWRLYKPDGTPLPHEECPMALALREQRAIPNAEICIERPDGKRIPALAYPMPMQTADGKMLGAINMIVDITERKKAEARQRVLIDELNHRVKNTLATVQSIAFHTARYAPTLDVFVEKFEARLRALARAHDLLTQRHWEGASLDEIVAEVLAPYREVDSRRVRVTGAPLRVPPRIALALTMALHELATNAAKYGCLSAAGGELSLQWARTAENDTERLDLHWTETTGRAVTAPLRRGFGTRVIERTIVTDLAGALDMRFEPAGLSCRISVPLHQA